MTSVGPDPAPTLSADSARAKLGAFDFHTAAAGAGLGRDRSCREAEQCDSRDQFLIENHDFSFVEWTPNTEVRAQLPLLSPAQGNHTVASDRPIACLLNPCAWFLHRTAREG